MKIPMLYAGAVFQSVSALADSCENNAVRFKLLKIKKGLEESINILRPLLTGNDYKWLTGATSLEIEPLTPSDLEAFDVLTPEQAQHLSLLVVA